MRNTNYFNHFESFNAHITYEQWSSKTGDIVTMASKTRLKRFDDFNGLSPMRVHCVSRSLPIQNIIYAKFALIHIIS